jgi:hypothetical protein
MNNKIRNGLTGLALLATTACSGKTNEAETEVKSEIVEIYNPSENEPHTTSRSGIGVALGDIDGDKDLDLIVASPTAVKYFGNNGEGRFYLKQNIYEPIDEPHTTSRSGISVALGDIDGDKNLDLIVASPTQVRAYLNINGKFYQQTK